MPVRFRFILLLAAACLSPAALPDGASAQEGLDPGPSTRAYQVTASETLQWKPDPEFPELYRALLYGTQTAAEPYVYRLRAYAPARLSMHAHARTEYITVLQGTLHHATGDATRASARSCGPGCFIVIPAGQAHRGWLDAGTIVQVHGVGPTEAHPSDPPATR